jgi:hypothetical protein
VTHEILQWLLGTDARASGSTTSKLTPPNPPRSKKVALIRGTVDQAEQERLRNALLDYCRQDTLALVKVFEGLRLSARNRLGDRQS